MSDRNPIYPNSSSKQTRTILGCMTGTSIDGLDASLVEIRGSGLEMDVRVRACISEPFGVMAVGLRHLADQLPMTAQDISELSNDFASFHLEVLRELVHTNNVDLIVLHGQTVYHSPPNSWQLINPTPIAFGLNVPVIYDLRAADLAHGGQGAPITPLADFILYRNQKERRCILNLGGFCNITQIPNCPGGIKDSNDLAAWALGIKGQDICSCNHLLDQISRELFSLPYDKDGAIAATGAILPKPFEELSSLIMKQANTQKSLGTGDELKHWLNKYNGVHEPKDLARTACGALADMISRPGPVDVRILSGGGVKNKTFVEEIRSRSNIPVLFSDTVGIPASHREAVAMAVLGALCWDRIPITIPKVTGVMESFISGCWVMP